MKIAIIGAGVSGLACAYELEKNSIRPVIFEKRNRVGNSTSYAGISLQVMSRGKGDPLENIDKKYGLKLSPISSLERITMISPNKRKVVKGNLGFIFKRGIEEYSLENQIGSLIKSPIIFDKHIEIEDIVNKFDHIIVATSDPLVPSKYNVWTETFNAKARIAIVLGDFDTSAATMWLNEEYARDAFAYLVPHNSKEATLTLIVNNCSLSELDYYWKNFLKIENIKYHINQENNVEHKCGFVSRFNVENIYFVGNAAGFTDDLIGVGAMNAIESGILAADSIIFGIDYNRAVMPISKDIVKFHELRKTVTSIGNPGYDRLISLLGMPGVKQFVYNNPFLKLQNGAFLARIYNHVKKNNE